MFTRVAADGIRLFSTAIPLALIFKATAIFVDWSNFEIYALSIIIIAFVSFFYTITGGVKGVIWADVIQMFIYIGGVFLSMASHGTDQLIVQRLLTTKTLKESQKTIIVSGIMVVFQFASFLIMGLLLYGYYNGISITDPNAPFHKPDEIFLFFIIHSLPIGVKGIIIAGLFAAAMSTLTGSISSLSSSVMLDWHKPLKGKKTDPKHDLYISRILTVISAIILTVVAFLRVIYTRVPLFFENVFVTL